MRSIIVLVLLVMMLASTAHAQDSESKPAEESAESKSKLLLMPVFRGGAGLSQGLFPRGETPIFLPSFLGGTLETGVFGAMVQGFFRPYGENQVDLAMRDVWVRATLDTGQLAFSGYAGQFDYTTTVGQFDYLNKVGYLATDTANDLRAVLDPEIRSPGGVAEILYHSGTSRIRTRLGVSRDFWGAAFEVQTLERFNIGVSMAQLLGQEHPRARLVLGLTVDSFTLNFISESVVQDPHPERIWDFACQGIYRKSLEVKFLDAYWIILSGGSRTWFPDVDTFGKIQGWFGAAEVNLIKGPGALYGVFAYSKELPLFGFTEPHRTVLQLGVKFRNEWLQ